MLDGYGHVSARHDRDAGRFLMSRSLAPELVTAADVLEYGLDSEPVAAGGRTSDVGRFTHGATHRERHDVRGRHMTARSDPVRDRRPCARSTT